MGDLHFDLDKLLKNPEMLDNFIANKVTRERVNEWDRKKKQKPQKPTPSYYLKYLSCDYQKHSNTKAHHTDKYVNKDLVVRRSQAFDLYVNFKNRSYDESKDHIVIEFTLGKNPTEMGGTKIRMVPGSKIEEDKWSCQLLGNDDGNKRVSIRVNIPNDALVGRYSVTSEIRTKSGSQECTRRYIMPDVCVVFNPFSKNDEVYMGNEAEREEYCMEENGLIFAGSWNKIVKMHWTFGQFEKDILDITFRLLNEDTSMKTNAAKATKMHGSPVFVSRVLSAMINSNDDKGMLVGNWSNDFSGGVAPTKWTASAKIFRQWNKKGSVKWGQCWVYSALFTTALRAIGIPGRTVTNFNSAHDTEFNMSLDKFFYEDGTENSQFGGNDSMWNFHVWNEAWMKRSDLTQGSEYDGWQAVDGTPQEKSGKVFRCGPCPLLAIKRGEVNIGYDADFLFGEVNADECKWQLSESDKIVKLLKKDTRKCGKCISTKAPGTFKRLDVTNLYKFDEGTKEEREAHEKAKLRGKQPKWHNKFQMHKEGPIQITIHPKQPKFVTGQPIVFTVNVLNTTSAAQECKITTRVESMFYTGKRKSGVKQVVENKVINAKQNIQFDVTATFAEYGFVITPCNSFRCVTSVKNLKTNDLYLDTQSTVLKHPKVLTISGPTQAKQGKFSFKYDVTNPFPIALSHCKLSLEGIGLDGEIDFRNPIVAHGRMSGTVEVCGTRKGRVKVVGNFQSKELSSIKTKCQVDIQ